MTGNRKGIILAGGNGTRLYPMTRVVTKQLLPVYDKPLIYYPLSILMLLSIREVLIIVKDYDLHLFQRLLGDGSHLGMKFSYEIQDEPRGLPEAFIIGRDFIGDDPVTMALGDNIFYGSGLVTFLEYYMDKEHKGASAFSYSVKDPQRFGVANYDTQGRVISLEEKPQNPKSPWAVSGLYHFDSDVAEKAARLKPSGRGELEIMDLLSLYHQEGRLQVYRMPRGYAWLDTGTTEAMMKAGQYIQILEERQGIKVACIEEIAYIQKFINRAQLEALIAKIGNNSYSDYLKNLLGA